MCPAVVSLCRSWALPEQQRPSTTDTTISANASDASVDFVALRQHLADQNKALTEQVTNQRALVKKNQELLKDAQRLDASNKKLMEEKKKLDAENVDLEKQRQALKTAQPGVQTADATD